MQEHSSGCNPEQNITFWERLLADSKNKDIYKGSNFDEIIHA